MVEVERAETVNISLYPEQIKAVHIYANFKKYKSISRAYQEIIDNFFNKDYRNTRNDFVYYILTPLVFVVFSTIVNISTFNVYTTLLKQGHFFNELFLLSQIFLVISFLSIGFFIACVYLFRKKYVESKKMNEVLDGNTDQ